MRSSQTIWIVLLMTASFYCWLSIRPAQHSRARITGIPVISRSSLNDSKFPAVTGILPNPQFSVVLHALEQRKGVQELAKPEVVTYSPSYYVNVNRMYYNM